MPGRNDPWWAEGVLILDDVVDSGFSLLEASRLLRNAGAAKLTTAVFARKPWPSWSVLEPDYVAWEAPARFLVGYGMDAAGKLRALPHIAALDQGRHFNQPAIGSRDSISA